MDHNNDKSRNVFGIDRNNEYRSLNQDEYRTLNQDEYRALNQDEYRALNQDEYRALNVNINQRRDWPLIRISLLLIFSPFVMAFVASLYYGGSIFNEGTGTGVYLWLLILTIPIGLIIITCTILLRFFRYCRRENRQ